MCSNDVGAVVSRHPGTTDRERDVDIFFVATGLAGLQSVLPNVESIVAAVDYVRVVEYAVVFYPSDQTIDQFVDCLQGSETLAIEMIIIVNIGLVLLW